MSVVKAKKQQEAAARRREAEARKKAREEESELRSYVRRGVAEFRDKMRKAALAGLYSHSRLFGNYPHDVAVLHAIERRYGKTMKVSCRTNEFDFRGSDDTPVVHCTEHYLTVSWRPRPTKRARDA